MKRKFYILLESFIMMTTFMLSSCNKHVVYDKYNHTPISGWEKNDTLKFDIQIAEGGFYQQNLGLRINGAYPFMSLCLIVEQTIYPSNKTIVDTLNCSLINKDGYAKGNGISYYQYNFNISHIELHKGDSIHVCIRHNMKREILPGISDVGFSLGR